MFKRILLLAFVCLLVAGCAGGTVESTPPPAPTNTATLPPPAEIATSTPPPAPTNTATLPPPAEIATSTPLPTPTDTATPPPTETATPTLIPTPTIPPLPDENAVYAAVFASRYDLSAGIVFVLLDHTTLGLGERDSLAGYLEEELPALEESTLSDFLTVNEQPRSLSDSLNLGIEYVLISGEERDAFFAEGGGGWEAFYRRYPQSTGIVELSGVGFSDAGDQALLYFGEHVYYLAGMGLYYLLSFENGVWVIIAEALAWIS